MDPAISPPSCRPSDLQGFLKSLGQGQSRDSRAQRRSWHLIPSSSISLFTDSLNYKNQITIYALPLTCVIVHSPMVQSARPMGGVLEPEFRTYRPRFLEVRSAASPPARPYVRIRCFSHADPESRRAPY